MVEVEVATVAMDLRNAEGYIFFAVGIFCIRLFAKYMYLNGLMIAQSSYFWFSKMIMFLVVLRILGYVFFVVFPKMICIFHTLWSSFTWKKQSKL